MTFLPLIGANKTSGDVISAGHDGAHNRSWVLFISGPTASGKSTVAKFLASGFNAQYIEGNDVRHTPMKPFKAALTGL